MPDLDGYFRIENGEHGSRERHSHPLIRLYDAQRCMPDFGKAQVQIIRPRAALGFEPAQLSLQFLNNQGSMYDYKTELWDAELNDALLDREVCAIDESNEIQRFGLALGAALQHPENRYGDGFFSAVLMLVIDQSPFAKMEQVRELRPYILTNKRYERGHSAEDCSVMVQAALQDRWLELRRKLQYDQNGAERILAAALAYYLDERFSITDGRKLGWLRAR